MLLEFRKANNATTAAKNIQDIYGEESINVRKCQRWFRKFRAGDTSLIDDSRPGRPVVLDDSLLLATLEKNPVVTVDELARQLNSTRSTVHRHLQQLGKISVLGKWVSSSMLSSDNYTDQVIICSLSSHQLKLAVYIYSIIFFIKYFQTYPNLKYKINLSNYKVILTTSINSVRNFIHFLKLKFFF